MFLNEKMFTDVFKKNQNTTNVIFRSCGGEKHQLKKLYRTYYVHGYITGKDLIF